MLQKSPQQELNAELLISIKAENPGGVAAALTAGADPSAPEGGAIPPLALAAMKQQRETVRLLLQYGADARARNDMALFCAACTGDRETVDMLAAHIFRPEIWIGKDPRDIESEICKLALAVKSILTESDQTDLPGAREIVDSIYLHGAIALHAARYDKAGANPISPAPAQPPRPL